MKVINLTELDAFYNDGTKENLVALLLFLKDKVNVKRIDKELILWYTIVEVYDDGETEETEEFGYDVGTGGYFVWDARNQELLRYEVEEFLNNFIEVKL